MTVEERRGSGDQFPVGLRVLAVDDDRACLKLLEGLLRRCQYHVTTTNQAIIALKLLRENKDKFDLIISDVHMPDMDGFKLLEHVGLEMDLPVIMLSANSDPKAVMKGITHGACDYLLKPVRLEELKNIWQHVVRRKKFDPRDVSSYDQTDDGDRSNQGNSEGGHGSCPTGSSDRSGRTNRKRKDQNEEEDDDDCDEDGHDNDDPSMQKKPRVVWSVELHRKFVAAVNQLGIDKAMPKRILDLMNVEKLTRENVASHLQKYRLYLKRISTVASQQANFVAALGGKDSAYLQMGSMDGLRHYPSFPGSGNLPALSSFQQGGMLGRLNSTMGTGLYGLGSSGMIQLSHGQNNLNNPMHDLGKLQNISFSGSTQPKLLQGMPTSLELSQLQQNKVIFDSRTPLNSSADAKFPAVNAMNNTQLLQPPQQPKYPNGFNHQPSTRIASLRSDPVEIGAEPSSYLADFHRRNDTWTGASSLTGYANNTLPLNVPFSHDTLQPNNVRGENVSAMSPNIDSDLRTVSSSGAVASSFPDAMMGRDFQSQASSLGGTMLVLPTSTNERLGFSDVGSSLNQTWQGYNQDQTTRTNVMYNSSLNPAQANCGIMNNVARNMEFSNGISSNRNLDVGINNSSFNAPVFAQNFDSTNSNAQLNPTGEFLLEPSKLQGACNAVGYNPFDDLMSAIVKREQDDLLMDGDIGCDIYSLETCM